MKKKIITSLLIVALSATTFVAGRFTAPEKIDIENDALEISELTQMDLMDTAVDNVQYWEVTDTGLNLYDYNGNVYEWR